MTKLGANLKLYINFKNRYIFYQYLFLFGLALYSYKLFNDFIKGAIQNNQYLLSPMVFFFFLMMLFGQTVIIIQMDILNKPFSFCLPNHQKTSRQVVFIIISIVGSLLYVLTFLIVFHSTGIKDFIHAALVPVMGLPFYFVSIYGCYKLRRNVGNPIFSNNLLLMLLLLLWGVLSSFFRQEYRLNWGQFVLYCFVPLLLSGSSSLYAVWKLLVDPEIGRKQFFNKNLPSNMIAFSDPAKAKQVRKDLLLYRLPIVTKKNDGIEDFFLSRLNIFPYLSIHRPVIGAFYEVIANISLQQRSFRKLLWVRIYLPTFIILSIGYFAINNLEWFMIKFAIFFAPCSIVAFSIKPYFHNQLLPLGRRERFQVITALSFIKTFVVLIWITLLMIVLSGLQRYAPVLIFSKESSHYFLFDPMLLCFTLVFIPIVDIFWFLDEKPGNVMVSAAIVLFYFTVIILILAKFAVYSLYFPASPVNTPTNILIMVLLILFTNGLYFGLIVHHCFRRDLVSSPL